jgi:hypothetical protein
LSLQSAHAVSVNAREAAVDDHLGSGHEAGGGRAEEHDPAGNLLRLAPAPERVLLVHPARAVRSVGAHAQRTYSSMIWSIIPSRSRRMQRIDADIIFERANSQAALLLNSRTAPLLAQ